MYIGRVNDTIKALNRTGEYKVLNYPKIGLNNLTWVLYTCILQLTYDLRALFMDKGRGNSCKKDKKNRVRRVQLIINHNCDICLFKTYYAYFAFKKHENKLFTF